jgi:hypothetical protein
MPKAPLPHVATLRIDIGKNSFRRIGLDARGAIVLRQKLSCGQIEAQRVNMPACLIGMEACIGARQESIRKCGATTSYAASNQPVRSEISD